MKKALSLKRLKKSFSYAIEGFLRTYREEPNMKIHTLIGILVIICGFIFKVSHIEWIFLIFAIGLVIGAEEINTSIESLVDLATSEFKEKAKIAKDTAAAYVMVLSITAAVIGLIIFIPKLINLWR
jgi:diacylglycerol kinase